MENDLGTPHFPSDTHDQLITFQLLLGAKNAYESIILDVTISYKSPDHTSWRRMVVTAIGDRADPKRIWGTSIANQVSHTSRNSIRLVRSLGRNRSETTASLMLKIQREPSRKMTLAIGSRELQRIVSTNVDDSVATG